MDEPPLGLGLIGCGAFGLFCLEAFSQMPEVRLVAAVGDQDADRLAACCGGAAADVTETFAPEERDVLGRGRLRHVTKRICVQCGCDCDKETLYARCLQSLLRDQILWARFSPRRPGRRHRRRLREQAGLSALRRALAAASRASKG